MPFNCNGIHNWSDPFYERVKTTRATKYPLTRMHLVQKCSACGIVVEVYDQHLVRRGGRIQHFPLAEEGAAESS